MRVLLSTMGSRGDVEPLVGLAMRLRALGAAVRVWAPPDEKFADRLAGVGVPLVPAGARSVTEKLGIRSVLGRPGGRPGHRHGTRRSRFDHRVPLNRAQDDLTPETRARATAVAGAIRADGATVAATLLLDAVSRERPPAFA